MGRLGIKGKEKEAGRPLHQRPSSTPSMKQRESNSDVGRDYKFSKSTPNDTNTILPKPPQMAHQLETKFSSIRGNGLIQTHTSSLLWTPSGSKRCLNGALYLVIQVRTRHQFFGYQQTVSVVGSMPPYPIIWLLLGFHGAWLQIPQDYNNSLQRKNPLGWLDLV